MKKKYLFGIIAFVFVFMFGIGLFVLLQNKEEKVDVKVPDYYAMAEYNFSGDFTEFEKDSYNWYRKIEHENGVFLINTDYYSDYVLSEWKKNNVYTSIPDKPFWYFTVSPSYLSEMNISIDEAEITNAENGVRLYLIPDNLTDAEAEKLELYLKEDALKNAEDSKIETTFTNNLEVKFLKYTPNGKYFTWVSDIEQETSTESPVIYVCTSENMKNYENESLFATGVDSYIKFANENIIQQYDDNDFIDRYSIKFQKSSLIYKNAAKANLVEHGIDEIFD